MDRDADKTGHQKTPRHHQVVDVDRTVQTRNREIARVTCIHSEHDTKKVQSVPACTQSTNVESTRRILELEKRNNTEHTISNMRIGVHLESSKQERNYLDYGGAETGLDQKPLLLANDGWADLLVDLCGACTTPRFIERRPNSFDMRPRVRRFFTRSSQQLHSQVSDRPCWVKRIHLRRLWRGLKEATWMTKNLKDKFQQSL